MSLIDLINPVALKEMRQLARSRFISIGLISYLAIVMLAVVLILLSRIDDLQLNTIDRTSDLGFTVFALVYTILSLVLMVGAPLFMGLRMVAERSSEHLDLQYTTALKPRQLIDGKMAAVGILFFLFASVSMPFLTLAYMLRGLNIFQALALSVAMMIIASLLVQLSLLFATVIVSKVLRILVGILFFAAVLSFTISWIGYSCVATVYDMFIFNRMVKDDYLILGILILAWLSLALFLRVGTIALLMPQSANGAKAVRWWYTFLWLLWGLIAIAYTEAKSNADPFIAWMAASIVATSVMAVFSMSRGPEYSRRVLAGISRHPLRRCGQFLFYSGSINGLLWAFLIASLTITLAITWQNGNLTPILKYKLPERDILPNVVMFFTLFAYILSGHALWRFIRLERWLSWRLMPVLVVLLVILGWLLPYILTLGSGHSDPVWPSTNPFAALYRDADTIPLFNIAVLWLAISALVNLPFFIGAMRRFRPDDLKKSLPATNSPPDSSQPSLSTGER